MIVLNCHHLESALDGKVLPKNKRTAAKLDELGLSFMPAIASIGFDNKGGIVKQFLLILSVFFGLISSAAAQNAEEVFAFIHSGIEGSSTKMNEIDKSSTKTEQFGESPAMYRLTDTDRQGRTTVSEWKFSRINACRYSTEWAIARNNSIDKGKEYFDFSNAPAEPANLECFDTHTGVQECNNKTRNCTCSYEYPIACAGSSDGGCREKFAIEGRREDLPRRIAAIKYMKTNICKPKVY